MIGPIQCSTSYHNIRLCPAEIGQIMATFKRRQKIELINRAQMKLGGESNEVKKMSEDYLMMVRRWGISLQKAIKIL